jgi:hypothetical protein
MAKIYVPAHTRADGTRVKGYTREIGGTAFAISDAFSSRTNIDKLSKAATAQRKTRILSSLSSGKKLTYETINPFAVKRAKSRSIDKKGYLSSSRQSSAMYGRPKKR